MRKLAFALALVAILAGLPASAAPARADCVKGDRLPVDCGLDNLERNT